MNDLILQELGARIGTLEIERAVLKARVAELTAELERRNTDGEHEQNTEL